MITLPKYTTLGTYLPKYTTLRMYTHWRPYGEVLREGYWDWTHTLCKLLDTEDSGTITAVYTYKCTRLGTYVVQNFSMW